MFKIKNVFKIRLSCSSRWAYIKSLSAEAASIIAHIHRHQTIGSRKKNAKLKHLYRPDPSVPESASTGRTTRSDEPTVSTAPTRRTVRFQIDGETFTVDAENFIDAFINDNLLVNNVAQAQALYDLLGIFIAEVERVRPGESRPNFTPDNVRLLPKLFTCRQKYRMMLRLNWNSNSVIGSLMLNLNRLV